MPRLVVKMSHQKAQVYPLKEGETVVGRGEECNLVLPNVSVSRQHARILVGRQNVTVEDNDSQNGIQVNGKPTKQQALKPGDEIQVGRFTLVFLSDAKSDRFYRGRCVDYMARYEPKNVEPEQSSQATFAMSADMLKKLQEDNSLIENARVIREDDPNRFWFPEDRGLTFGGDAQVHVDGWLAWGEVASISWDGKQHVIERKTSWRAQLVVNNDATERRALKSGDRFRVANSRFKYDAR